MSLVFIYILLPVIAAVIAVCLKEKQNTIRNFISFASSAIVLVYSFFHIDKFYILGAELSQDLNLYMMIKTDALNSFLIFAVSAFIFLVLIYSIKYLEDKPNAKWFHFNLLITLSFSIGALMSDSLLLLLFFWEGLLLTLYGFLILSNNTQRAKDTA